MTPYFPYWFWSTARLADGSFSFRLFFRLPLLSFFSFLSLFLFLSFFLRCFFFFFFFFDLLRFFRLADGELEAESESLDSRAAFFAPDFRFSSSASFSSALWSDSSSESEEPTTHHILERFIVFSRFTRRWVSSLSELLSSARDFFTVGGTNFFSTFGLSTAFGEGTFVALALGEIEGVAAGAGFGLRPGICGPFVMYLVLCAYVFMKDQGECMFCMFDLPACMELLIWCICWCVCTLVPATWTDYDVGLYLCMLLSMHSSIRPSRAFMSRKDVFRPKNKAHNWDLPPQNWPHVYHHSAYFCAAMTASWA